MSRKAPVAIAALALGLSAGVFWFLRAREPEQPLSLVVLPFVDLSLAQNREHFTDGLTDEVIYRLSSIPELRTISRTSAMHYRKARKSIDEIAGELQVTHVLEGSVRESGDSVRVSARLIDARDSRQMWKQDYTYALTGIFRIQEEIALDVARTLDFELGDRSRRLLVRRGTNDPQAYELYRRGRHVWNLRTAEGHEQAITYFEQALARDSMYADAYAALADVYLTDYQLNLSGRPEQEAYTRLREAAERAVALDAESADAHTAFAIATWWQNDWPGAERELQRAIELNPGHATARSWYSLLLRGLRRPTEAREQSRRSVELDPFAVVTNYNHAWQCYLDRDYECAATQYATTIAIGAYPSAYRGLGLVQAQEGKLAEAVASVSKAVEMRPDRTDFHADLAYVQARAGDTVAARTSLRRARDNVWEGFNLARAYMALGEPDSAFAWLERSNWRWPHRAVATDPALDPIRGDPRLSTLIARIEREMGLRERAAVP